MLWCCLSLILSMLDWTLRLLHQWNSVFYHNLNHLCSYHRSLFMKIVENCFWKILKKIQFHEFQSIEIHLRSIKWDRILLENFITCFDWSKFILDRSNDPFLSVFMWWFSLYFRLIEICLWSIECSFLIDWVSIELGRRFGTNFFTFSIDREKGLINRMLWILNFSKCFHTFKVQGYVWWDYTWFLIKNLSFKISSGREIQESDLTASVKDIFLCNWHIVWQNTLYLFVGKSKKVLWVNLRRFMIIITSG